MKNNYSYYITLLLLLFFCVSCENEEGVVGSSIIVNENHNIVSYPSDEATASLMRYSNILASETDVSLLGNFDNGIFGNQNGFCAFEIKPDSLIEGTMTSISVISLTIPYDGFYANESITADMIADISISVSKLESVLKNDLYTYEGQINAGTKLDCVIDNINMLDIETTDNLTLDLTSCQDLKNSIQSSIGNSEDLNTFQNEFLNTFHGLLLRQESSDAMMLLNTKDAVLNVQYSNETADTNIIQFSAGSDNLIASSFLTNSDPSAISPTYNIYLQSMGGSYSEIDMQFLTDLKEEGYIAVNDAELILHISEENGDFPLPNNLVLYQFSDNESIDFANATAISESDNLNTEDQTYMFNMTGLIHEIINGEREPIFQLYLKSSTSEMNRLLLDNDFELNLLLIKEEN